MASYKDGNYHAENQGMHDLVKVDAKIKNNKIVELQIDASKETKNIGQLAAPKMQAKILAAQSADVDVISGASVTSNAIKKDIQEIINEASGKPAQSKSIKKAPDWLGNEPEIDSEEIKKVIHADIVIVGGGNAGTMCAFAASEKHKKVAVIEAQAEDNVYYYGMHDIAAVNSDFQLENGAPKIKKSEFIAEYQRRTHNRTDPMLVKQFVDNSGAMIDWLMDHTAPEVVNKACLLNVTSKHDYLPQGREINKFTSWTGAVQINYNAAAPKLIADAEKQGAKWYWETKGVKLIHESYLVEEQDEKTSENGEVSFFSKKVPHQKVTGVIAKDKNGQFIEFLANDAVVLTGGDYGGNPQMYEALQDEKRNVYEAHGLDTEELHCPSFGRDGSGIKMALWAGATMDPGPRCAVDPQVILNSDKYATNVLRWGSSFSGQPAPEIGASRFNPWGSPFIYFDSNGKRFTDETVLGVFGMRERVERSKPGRYFAIWDSQWPELMRRSIPEHFSVPTGGDEEVDLYQEFQSWLDRGAKGAKTNPGETVSCWGAQDLDTLLTYMHLNEEQKENIKAEIAKYNHFCEQGEDTDFGRDPKLLLPVNKGPFFGMYFVEDKPMTGIVTLNGVNTDSEQRVVDSNWNPIDNLYACGNNAGERFAIEYSTPMQGLTLGMAMTLGWVLGYQLAQK